MKRLGVCLILAAATACAGKTPSSGGGGSAPRRDRDLITQGELADPTIRTMDLISAVRRLRPHFLTVRGATSFSDASAGSVRAAIDGGGVVPLNDLRTIHVDMVVEIRYLNAGAAMQRYGGAAREGPVIVVRTIPRT